MGRERNYSRPSNEKSQKSFEQELHGLIRKKFKIPENCKILSCEINTKQTITLVNLQLRLSK